MSPTLFLWNKKDFYARVPDEVAGKGKRSDADHDEWHETMSHVERLDFNQSVDLVKYNHKGA